MASPASSKNIPARIVAVAWLVAVSVGLFQAWVSRNAISVDGVCYLDLGDAYLRGDWEMALNGLWSPLYAWLSAVPLHLLKAGAVWETPILHIINFVIYAGALASFHFFLLAFIAYERRQTAEHPGTAGLPQWAWLSLGYALFVWGTLNMVNVTHTTPDLLLSAFVYLATGLILRMRTGAVNHAVFLFLGVVLGAGYLAKAVMFPLSFFFLGAALFSVKEFRLGLRRTAIAFFAFAVMASPLVIALSKAKGRLVFSDAGRLNYLWHVNGVTAFAELEQSPPGRVSRYGITKIFDEPVFFQYPRISNATYPLWYDPSTYYDQANVELRWKELLNQLRLSAGKYYRIFAESLGGVFVGLAVLMFSYGSLRLSVGNLARQWFLFAPPLAALFLYTLVHVEGRYVGAFVTLLSLAGFAGVRLPNTAFARKLICTVSAVVLAIMLTKVAASIGRTVSEADDYSNIPPAEIADGLAALGLRPRDQVVHVGYSRPVWARLARLQVIAEILWWEGGQHRAFWGLTEERRKELFRVLAETGAKAIVTDSAPGPAEVSRLGWQRLGRSNYYAVLLIR